MFLGLKPFYAVVTNIEHDHPDCYPTFEDMYAAFAQFVDLLPVDGALVACLDDAAASALMNAARKSGRRVVAYGLQGESTLNAPHWMMARGVRPNARGGFDFEAVSNLFSETEAIPVSLQAPGVHNVQNSLAALAVVSLMGLPPKKAAEALGEFRGAARRFEVLGEADGVVVVNDYGHHPTEIRAALAAARARYPGRRVSRPSTTPTKSSSPKSTPRARPRRISPARWSSVPCAILRRILPPRSTTRPVTCSNISAPATR
ncbi:MAG: hypothetical protein DCC54_12020 [Anaerolineae bacterium]|nr:MAG: hypothetical protein DCC54_12020 [Anaerolineae bacterium]